MNTIGIDRPWNRGDFKHWGEVIAAAAMIGNAVIITKGDRDGITTATTATASGEMERSCARAVDAEDGNTAMQHVKHPPVRNKINMADSAQVRAWTKRLGVPVEVLKATVDKVGNSISAVTKEIELQRTRLAATVRPVPDPAAESKLSAAAEPVPITA